MFSLTAKHRCYPRCHSTSYTTYTGQHRRRRRRLSAAMSPVAAHPRRYAVLKAGHSTAYVERDHGGYAVMLARLLRDDDERWDIFHVVDGDFSFFDNADVYDGFVITGSAADAHDCTTPWINRLADVVTDLHDRRKKVLGICFGHQIIARALGGRTGRAESVGWELGVKTMKIDADKIQKFYGLSLPANLNIIESHQDQVSIVPPGAEVLASSEKTDIEMFAIRDHILCIQGHPEFTKSVLLDLVQSRLSAKVISEEVAKEAIESFSQKVPDDEPLKRLCKTFLKGHVHNI